MRTRLFLSMLLTSLVLTLLPTTVWSQDNAPQVNLLEAGAEPRRELRYQFAAGTTETALMDMTMTMSMSMGGQTMPTVELPTMRTNLTLVQVEVDAEQVLTYTFEVASTDIVGDADPMIAAELRTNLAQMNGLSGTVRVDNRGVTLSGGLELPADMDPSMAQMMDNMEQQMQQLSAPLPVEAVGVGGSWEVVTNMDVGGFQMMQRAQYTVTELRDDAVICTLTLTQNAPAQPLDAPGMPPGASATLDMYHAEGNGNANISLNSLVPVSTGTVSGTMSSTITAGGESQNMSMQMGLTMAIAPAPATP